MGRGFASGVAATAAMSVVMFAAQKAGLTGRLPPSKITDAMLSFARVRPFVPSPARKALAAANHLAFGGVSGALFGLGHALLTRPREPRVRAPRGAGVAAGIAFGTTVWALSYAGWVPALGIMRSPKNDRAGRPTSMLIAHWVYGAVLAKLMAGPPERADADRNCLPYGET